MNHPLTTLFKGSDYLKKTSKWLILGIVLLGASMRMPITMISPLLDQIAHGFNLQSGVLGGITTIPLLCFAIVSPLAPRLAAKYSNEVVMFGAMIILAIANFLRVFTPSALFIGTLFIGIAIAMLNVLLPATIAEKYPQRIGPVTSIYTFSMTLFSAITAGLSAPVAGKIGWPATLQSVSVIVVIGLLIWLPNLRYRETETVEEVQMTRSVWRVSGAWFLTIYMGIQSLIFYTTVTWLPTILINHGLTPNTASLMLGLSQLASLPAAYFVPIWAAKQPRQTGLITTIAVFYVISLLLLMLPTTSLVVVVAVALLLGITGNATFTLAIALFSLKTSTPRETAAISGMAQSGGYLLAAVGPLGFGLIHDLTHSWVIPLLVLIILLGIMAVAGLAVDRKKTVFD